MCNEKKSAEYITLETNDNNTSNDKERARIFKKFFLKIVPNVRVHTNHDSVINAEYLDNPIDKAIIKCYNHQSILTIKNFAYNCDSFFSFQHVSKSKITRIINTLDSKQVIQSTDIPTKLLKGFSGFFSD